MLLSLLVASALAGDLHVHTESPVMVRVDGTPLDYAPGSMRVQVAGLTGIHKVQISSMSGTELASMNVNIPANETVNLHHGPGGLAVRAASASSSVSVSSSSSSMSLSVTTSSGGVQAAAAADKPTAMDAGHFAGLLASVKNESFSDDQLTLVRGAAGNWFSIAQLGQLMDQLSMGDDKVAVASALSGRVVDPNNAHALNAHLSFSDDKDAVAALFR
jgi:hypothetical protein